MFIKNLQSVRDMVNPPAGVPAPAGAIVFFFALAKNSLSSPRFQTRPQAWWVNKRGAAGELRSECNEQGSRPARPANVRLEDFANVRFISLRYNKYISRINEYILRVIHYTAEI